MATRKEVADLAGVSTATVSHVINNTKFVSEDLREKVLDAARKLNYVPNHAARMLTTKKTHQIAMLVSDISNPYYGELAAGMEEVARQNKYVLSLCSTESSPDNFITTVIERQMDGIFMAITNHKFSSEVVEKLIAQEIPVVIAESASKKFGNKVSYMFVNYKMAIEKMLLYLKDLGHTNIGFLFGLGEDSTDTRLTVFKEILPELGLQQNEDLIVYGSFPYRTDFQAGYLGMKELFSRVTPVTKTGNTVTQTSPAAPVTAIFCTNDLMAFGAMKAIREAGLRIPQDISIVGCDDIFFAETSDPPLTTISIPKRDMGRRVVDLLLGEIETGKTSSDLVNGELLIRASTGPCSK